MCLSYVMLAAVAVMQIYIYIYTDNDYDGSRRCGTKRIVPVTSINSLDGVLHDDGVYGVLCVLCLCPCYLLCGGQLKHEMKRERNCEITTYYTYSPNKHCLMCPVVVGSPPLVVVVYNEPQAPFPYWVILSLWVSEWLPTPSSLRPLPPLHICSQSQRSNHIYKRFWPN